MPQPVKAKIDWWKSRERDVPSQDKETVTKAISSLEVNLNNLSDELKTRFNKLVVSQLSLQRYRERDFCTSAINTTGSVGIKDEDTINNLSKEPAKRNKMYSFHTHQHIDQEKGFSYKNIQINLKTESNDKEGSTAYNTAITQGKRTDNHNTMAVDVSSNTQSPSNILKAEESHSNEWLNTQLNTEPTNKLVEPTDNIDLPNSKRLFGSKAGETLSRLHRSNQLESDKTSQKENRPDSTSSIGRKFHSHNLSETSTSKSSRRSFHEKQMMFEPSFTPKVDYQSIKGHTFRSKSNIDSSPINKQVPNTQVTYQPPTIHSPTGLSIDALLTGEMHNEALTNSPKKDNTTACMKNDQNIPLNIQSGDISSKPLNSLNKTYISPVELVLAPRIRNIQSILSSDKQGTTAYIHRKELNLGHYKEYKGDSSKCDGRTPVESNTHREKVTVNARSVENDVQDTHEHTGLQTDSPNTPEDERASIRMPGPIMRENERAQITTSSPNTTEYESVSFQTPKATTLDHKRVKFNTPRFYTTEHERIRFTAQSQNTREHDGVTFQTPSPNTPVHERVSFQITSPNTPEHEQVRFQTSSPNTTEYQRDNIQTSKPYTPEHERFRSPTHSQNTWEHDGVTFQTPSPNTPVHERVSYQITSPNTPEHERVRSPTHSQNTPVQECVTFRTPIPNTPEHKHDTKQTHSPYTPENECFRFTTHSQNTPEHERVSFQISSPNTPAHEHVSFQTPSPNTPAHERVGFQMSSPNTPEHEQVRFQTPSPNIPEHKRDYMQTSIPNTPKHEPFRSPTHSLNIPENKRSGITTPSPKTPENERSGIPTPSPKTPENERSGITTSSPQTPENEHSGITTPSPKTPENERSIVTTPSPKPPGHDLSEKIIRPKYVREPVMTAEEDRLHTTSCLYRPTKARLYVTRMNALLDIMEDLGHNYTRWNVDINKGQETNVDLSTLKDDDIDATLSRYKESRTHMEQAVVALKDELTQSDRYHFRVLEKIDKLRTSAMDHAASCMDEKVVNEMRILLSRLHRLSGTGRSFKYRDYDDTNQGGPQSVLSVTDDKGRARFLSAIDRVVKRVLGSVTIPTNLTRDSIINETGFTSPGSSSINTEDNHFYECYASINQCSLSSNIPTTDEIDPTRTVSHQMQMETVDCLSEYVSSLDEHGHSLDTETTGNTECNSPGHDDGQCTDKTRIIGSKTIACCVAFIVFIIGCLMLAYIPEISSLVGEAWASLVAFILCNIRLVHSSPTPIV